MFRRVRSASIAASALLFAQPIAAHPDEALVGGAIIAPGEIAITGMLDGRRDRLEFAGVSVSINGRPASVAADGHFGGTFALAPTYRVEITGPGIFAAIQTFATAELRDETCSCLAIPSIEVVARSKDRIELFFGGDTMAGRRYFEPPSGQRQLLYRETLAADLDRLLAPMRPYMESADLASVNLETVLADSAPGEPLPGKSITFFSPPELAHALKRAGVDYVTLGNNHIYDYGEPGIASTIAALDQAGLAYSGAGHDEAQAVGATRLDIGKASLALLGFVGWEGSNGAHQIATADKGGAAFGTRGQVRRSVERERKLRNVPVLQYHGGAEYIDRPSATTIGRLREAVEQGAPLAIGHHPHLVMGVEVYRKALVAPSIGNFLFDQQHPRTHVTYAIRAILEKGRFLRAEFVPVGVVDYRPVPAVGAMRERVLRRLFGFSAERGTRLAMSGGHAVVYANQRGGLTGPCHRRSEGEFKLAGFAPACEGVRLGRDVIARGDFTMARQDDAVERALMSDDAGLEFVMSDGEAHAVLRPEKAASSPALFTHAYLRDVPAGAYTLRARVLLPVATRVELRIKDRPYAGAQPSARWRGEILQVRDVPAAANWQDISFDFVRPEEADGHARPFRPILRFVPANSGGNLEPIAIDDFELISWSVGGETEADRWQASHVAH
ncbi:CapA family protein [Qipengyuania sp. XHP0207]|uniref:CapA family protein n=1 Tax=Qipengyuania sp. XHP0207 TaxID=3038078 RepID=UPI00241D214E|nr:CapA family protein [Qipengyuania sp. XHP0207]MDG5747380.1 CapA family protein [Qipengyuania sp. XHP0207]